MATVAECYEPVLNEDLPHQHTIHFTPGNAQVVGSCNCGWRGTPRRPEDPNTLTLLKIAYAAHVTTVAVCENHR